MGERRSRTAQGVAAERAILHGMGVVDDADARAMLTPSTAVALWLVMHGPRRLRSRSSTLAGLAARVLWFDAQVAAALDSGIAQVVTVGAGYDSRAWRCRRAGARFFELDHGATQRDKVRRAPGVGPTYVEADLRTVHVGDAVVAGGLDPSRPTLAVLEGVTMYLDEAVVRRLLHDLAATCAPGSRLAVDFYPPRSSGTTHDRRQRRAQRLARLGSSEGFRLVLDRARAVDLIEVAGWVVHEATGLRTAARDLGVDRSALPVARINDHKALLAAHRP